MGDDPTFHAPVSVVTHRPAEPIVKAGGTTCTFVTDGPQEALRRARQVARDKDIRVEGGAAIVRQYLLSGVIDELRLHVVPILLGGGTRLFTDPDRVQSSSRRPATSTRRVWPTSSTGHVA